MKMALMVIDLQKAYYRGESKASMDAACEYINAVLPMFRRKKLPILWIQHIDEEDGSAPGKEGFDFIDLLEPGKDEYRIHKKYGNSFNKTDCLEILRKNGVDTILITGYCAEHCVLSTFRGAEDVDIQPVILRNGIASGNAENLRFVEKISTIISFGILAKMMED